MKNKKMREARKSLKRATKEIKDLCSKLDAVRAAAFYMTGVIEGLKFATKCNGISGAEIEKEPNDDDATHIMHL